MKSFKNRLGEDGTFIDFCRWYGGDCGDCHKLEDGFPECYEPFVEGLEAKSNKPNKKEKLRST